MLKLLSLTTVFGAICMLAPLGAGASPLGVAKGTAIESEVLQVRDGCGRGMRFSNRRQACVEDFDRGPQERYIEERPVYRDRVYRDDGAAAAGAAAGAIVDGIVGGPRYYDDVPRRRYP